MPIQSERHEKELKCHEYIYAIKDIEHFSGQGLYGLDNMRSRIHDDLCELFGLTKEKTKEITDNIDKLDFDAGKLYLALLAKAGDKHGKKMP